MLASILAGFPVILLLATVLLQPSVGFPATLTLERAFPTNHGVELSQLRERDAHRHGRFLQSDLGGVVDFTVQGTYDPFRVGLYFTRVLLGSPPKEFYVQIDTGSDVLWVSCNGCNGCPTSSGLQIELEFFDPSSSSSASSVTCSDRICALGSQTSDSGCSAQGDQCSYTFQYGDGSGTAGYYVADLMHLDTILGNSVTSSSTAKVVFGCSTSQTGDLTKSDRAVDGIFGFGQQGLSVVSQLSSQGIAPSVFSHCLVGTNGGGGILVLGQIEEPNIVYTPLVPSHWGQFLLENGHSVGENSIQNGHLFWKEGVLDLWCLLRPHYNLNLLSISVNGQTLSIDSEVFATSSNRGGTIIDSGTTLAYLAEDAYDPFVNAITQSVSQSVRPLVSKGNQCYLISSSLSEIFPLVSLNFAEGASMLLKPEDYLLQQNSIGGAAVWCIGFQKIQGQRITILGDLVLKDKIVVYDLGGQRIGWANYDCSQAVNVSEGSNTGKSEFVNAGLIDRNSSTKNTLFNILMIPVTILAVFLHISLYGTVLSLL